LYEAKVNSRAIFRSPALGEAGGLRHDSRHPDGVHWNPEGSVVVNACFGPYGWGVWEECDGPAYVPACDTAPIISSAGALGFTPWIDFDKGYGAILIIEEAHDNQLSGRRTWRS
jgi:hypothetical protein